MVLYVLALTICTAPIFNGHSLDGLTTIGPPAWTMETTDAGVSIIGSTAGLSEPSWLLWPGPASDFVLTVAFRIDTGSAPIAYRCHVDGDRHMRGYTTQIDAANAHTGALDDVGGRGRLTPPGARRRFGFQDNRQDLGVVGDADALLADITPGTWHTLRITATGPHLQHHIDGRLVTETWDEDPSRRHAAGGIAFGLAPGTDSRVMLRHIDLRRLDTSSDDDLDSLQVPAGFDAEKLLDASEGDGSWVSMAFEPDGDLLVSPQRGRVRRIHLATGTSEPIAFDIGHAQGMVHAYGALYVIVSRDPPHGGLHRLRDTTGDGRYDEHEHLAVWGNGSEHGPHAIRLGPDGMLWIVQGNHTALPPRVDLEASPFRGWAEDLLLERQWDANGHAVGITSPGGVVLRTDPDATSFEINSGGLRNACDLAFTPDGSCFTFDSDMEWDMGMPWYRAPRVVHVLPGADNGWRAGTGKWADWYPDALPAVAHTPPASPTAVVHAGDGAFGAVWEGVLLLADWSYGRIWSLEPKAKGASFTGSVKVFAQGRPFNVSCMRFAPKPDGALYVITGGRGTQSSLWRIAADNPQWIAPQVDIPLAMTQRTRLERAGSAGDLSLDEVWRHLGTGDRAMSTAARSALHAFPPDQVRDRALRETDPPIMVDGLVHLAKAGSPADRDEALLRLAAATTRTGDVRVQADVLRGMALMLTRHGDPDASVRDELVRRVRRMLQSNTSRVRREAARVLVHLEADINAWLLAQMESTHGEDALYWALLARLHRGDWTPAQELHYLRWLRRHRGVIGGQSAAGFIRAFESRFVRDMNDANRASLLGQLEDENALLPPQTQREHVAHWTIHTLTEAVATAVPEGDGEAVFTAGRCVECHRFRGRGSATGPDLTGIGGRLNEKDLLLAIVEPNRDVSDQYAATWVETKDGLFTGRLIDVDARRIVLDIDPFGPVRTMSIPRSDILSMDPSDVSTMPPGLLNTFTAEEIAALLDWLRRP